MSSPFVFSKPPVAFQPVVITGGATTTIVDGSNELLVVTDFEVGSTDGTSSNLTVELFNNDSSTHIYLTDEGGTCWNAQAITAHKGYRFSAIYPIPIGYVLRVVNSAGNFVVFGRQLPSL